MQHKIFPDGVPERAVWADSNRIIDILDLVGFAGDVNHMLLPWGGGMDLVGAQISAREPDCIELVTPGRIYLMKAKCLLFESFDGDSRWNYFWLETGRLKPSGIYTGLEQDSFAEYVVDTNNGEYVAWSNWDGEMYDGSEIPENTRYIVRCFRGSFLIIQKTAPFNRLPGTYLGRHGEMTADEFSESYQHLRNRIRT